MPTFKFKKPISEIEEPQLLPEGWTKVRISSKPEIQPNRDQTGENLVVQLRTIADDVPENDNRMLTIWLSMPTEADENEFTGRGQRKSDAKMQNIVNFVEAFGGDVGDDEVLLDEGMMGQVYVEQRINQNSGEVENSVNIFQGFKSFDED